MRNVPSDTPVRLVVINAGVGDPSTTRLLADQVAQKSIEAFEAAGLKTSLSVVDLAPLAGDIARAMVAGFPGEKLAEVLEKLAGADAVIAAAPVYKAGLSGLFKSFVDLMDNDLLIARPMILVATAGSARHAMVLDDHMRALFAFMRALPVPTAIFAAPEDWSAPELSRRIARAARELAAFVSSGVGRDIAGEAWEQYQHQFGSKAARTDQGGEIVDFDTDLMRLATGGAAK
ncbi:MAG: NADH-dependent reductase [Devosia sp.]|uniref:CE1759 family FMN reductase n=1 Tax=Devosia sp. TaxID=1871048 RepID=UPI002636CAFA|nr:CE1759 family FMN reductase [Devosia sp.]MDB5527384.1 NADH-dependent reductase [Devosia sp.]